MEPGKQSFDISDLTAGFAKMKLRSVVIPPDAYISMKQLTTFLETCRISDDDIHPVAIAVGIQRRERGLGIKQAFVGDKTAKWLVKNYGGKRLVKHAEVLIKQGTVPQPYEVDLVMAMASLFLKQPTLGSNELRRAISNSILMSAPGLVLEGTTTLDCSRSTDAPPVFQNIRTQGGKEEMEEVKKVLLEMGNLKGELLSALPHHLRAKLDRVLYLERTCAMMRAKRIISCCSTTEIAVLKIQDDLCFSSEDMICDD